MDLGGFDLDQRVRVAAFDFLAQQAQRTPDGVLPRTLLATGFTFDDIRVPLIDPQGIFKPGVFSDAAGLLHNSTRAVGWLVEYGGRP